MRFLIVPNNGQSKELAPALFGAIHARLNQSYDAWLTEFHRVYYSPRDERGLDFKLAYYTDRHGDEQGEEYEHISLSCVPLSFDETIFDYVSEWNAFVDELNQLATLYNHTVTVPSPQGRAMLAPDFRIV